MATAFSRNPVYFYACRFFTGAGIGGEYAAMITLSYVLSEIFPMETRAMALAFFYAVGAGIGEEAEATA